MGEDRSSAAAADVDAGFGREEVLRWVRNSWVYRTAGWSM